jgi:hypothetical protein
MAASRDTRYLEAAHALAAHFLGVGLGEEGMILISDKDAWVEVEDVRVDETDEDWYLRRAAVTLAGPLAACQLTKEKVDWKAQRFSPQHHTDIQDAMNVFRRYWRKVRQPATDEKISEQMDRAASIAIWFVQNYEAAIAAVADAAEGRDRLSRSEIVATIATYQKPFTCPPVS